MKIQAETLRKFIEKASVGGKIPTMFLDFRSDGVVCNIRSMENIMITSSILKRSNFKDYQEKLQLCIKNSAELINYLKVLEGEIVIEVIENNLFITDGNFSFDIALASKEYIENIISDDDIAKLNTKFTGGFVLNKDVIRRIIKAGSIMKNDTFEIVIENGIMNVKAFDEKSRDRLTVKNKVDYRDCKAVYNAEYLSNILEVIENDAEISLMKEDAPILVKESNDSWIIKLAMAPKILE